MACCGCCNILDELEYMVALTLRNLSISCSCGVVLNDSFLGMAMILPPAGLLMLWELFETNWISKCFVVLCGKNKFSRLSAKVARFSYLGNFELPSLTGSVIGGGCWGKGRRCPRGCTLTQFPRCRQLLSRVCTH